MKKKMILTLLSVVFLGLGSKLLEAQKNNNCSFYIQNNTDGKLAIQTFDETGLPLKTIEIHRGKQKMFKKMLNVPFALSSKPAYSRNDYMLLGTFTLTSCPDTKMTFSSTDFMDYTGEVPMYFQKTEEEAIEFEEETIIPEEEETESQEMVTPYQEEEIMITEDEEPEY